MKKTILILACAYFAALCISCAAPTSKADSPEGSGTAPPTAAEAAAETAAAAAQTTAAVQENPADSGLTLEGIKKAARSAGFEIGYVDEYQLSGEPEPVGSFNIIYIDDNSQANIPVFEYKNAEDALRYAAEVNAEGYNLCIINGKFLTMTGSKYGVPLNDNQKTLLETLLKSEVMAYTAPGPAPFKAAADYAGACAQIDVIYQALDMLVNKSVLLHDKSAAADARIENAFVSFTLISSGDLSFTENLSEDQAQLDAVKQLWEVFGVADMKITHDAANDYILTGQRMGLDTTFELHCSFDTGTGSLRLVDTDGGQVLELLEYVPLGGDKYAFQTLYERAIVEYKNDKIASLIYSLNVRDNEHAYNAETDGIYGNRAGIDAAWVSGAGADSYDQFITYDGITLKIAADSMLGDRLNVEIKVQQ